MTDNTTSTLDIGNLTTTIATWLDGELPNHNVTSNATSITIEAVNPGVAFSVSSNSSSTFSLGTASTIQPPSYFEISGVASSTAVVRESYVYTLTANGPVL